MFTYRGNVQVYAVVETGGRQYRVRQGQTITVNKLPVEAGETIELDRVLLVANEGDGGEVAVGQPTVPGAKVIARVVGQERGPKIIVFRYKPKVRYRRKTGHRQHLTRLEIQEIVRE